MALFGCSASGAALLAACALTTDLSGFSNPAATSALTDGQAPDGRVLETAAGDSGGAPELDGGGTGTTDARVRTYADVVLEDEPVAYWPFDEAVNSVKVTERVSKRQGDVDGNVTFGVPGLFGTGVKVERSGAIDFGDILDFTGEQAWSYEAWAFPTFTSEVFYEFFNKRGNENGVVVYVRKENNSLTAQLEQPWASGARGVDVPLPAPDHWIHIVFTYTPGLGVRGWADGKPGNLGYDAPGGPTGNDAPLRIVSSFHGTFDELAVYDKPLAPERIAAHYAAGRK